MLDPEITIASPPPEPPQIQPESLKPTDSEPAGDFFTRVRPRLEIETPYGYHPAVDLRSWRSISLLENITVTRAARFLHSDQTFTRAAIEDLLGDLSTMHGTMWKDPDMERADSFMRTPMDLLHSIKSSINMRKPPAIGAQRAKAVIPPLARVGGQAPELEAAWDAYRTQILYPYHAWTYTIGRGPLQPKMQPDRLCLPIIERTATAIADHGSIELAHR